MNNNDNKIIIKSSTFIKSDIITDTPDPSTDKSRLLISSINTLPHKIKQYIDDIPILIFCYNRADSLLKTIESINRYKPKIGYPLFISQDGNDINVKKIATLATDNYYSYTFKGVKQIPGQSVLSNFMQYYKIASHYEFALGKLFETTKYDRVIIMEDDMDISADFFSYFRNMAPIFDMDPTVYCVSAWNDNGISSRVYNPKKLYRTDCFPGLGWMMPRSLWNEFKDKWASGFWDDWMRLEIQRKGRTCIRPEINRVSTFGSDGASGGQFFDHLSKIKLNKLDDAVDFSQFDLSTLIEPNYSVVFSMSIQAAKIISYEDLSKLSHSSQVLYSDLRWFYNSFEDLNRVLVMFSLMTDHKEGIPRTSYKGVVHFSYGGIVIYLVPNFLKFDQI